MFKKYLILPYMLRQSVFHVLLSSGGTAVTVSGERLDLSLNPLIALYVDDDMFTSVSRFCLIV